MHDFTRSFKPSFTGKCCVQSYNRVCAESSRYFHWILFSFFHFFYQFWWICWALFPLFVSIGSIVLLVGPEFDGVALFSLFCLYWIHSRWSKSPLSALEQIISEKKTTSTMATSKLKRFLSSWTRYYIAAGADAFINSGTANVKSVFFSNIK